MTLSLHAAGAVYQVGWEKNCGCNAQKPPAFVKLVARPDNHMLAWYCWKKEQKQNHSRKLWELQRLDNINTAAFGKVTQEKEQAMVIAQQMELKCQMALEMEQ